MKKKVLCFIPSIGSDGITKIMFDIYSKFNLEKYQIDFMAFEVEDISYVDVNLYKIYKINSNKVKRYIEEFQIMKKNKYDIVHVNGNRFARFMECMIAKMAHTKKVIIHSHNTGSSNLSKFKKFLNNKLKFLFFPFCDNYLACSDMAAEWLFPKSVIRNNRVKKINNGIDINKFKFDKEIRKRYRCERNINDNLVIGHIGRFEEQKNHEFIIELFKKIYQKDNKARLILIGNGSLKNKIKLKVKNNKLEKVVEFYDVRTDVNALLMMMDVFLFPSKFEGLGTVLIEAQATGLKCFISDVIPKEVNITNNIYRFNLKENNYEELVNDILNIDKHEDNRENAFQMVASAEFDIETVSKKMEYIYEEIFIEDETISNKKHKKKGDK